MSAFISSQSYRRCQALFDRTYPGFRDAGSRYRDLVADATTSNAVLLDVGCGRTSLAADAIRKAKVTFGVELSISDLEQNDTVTHRIAANAGQMPFRGASFDVLTSQWVVEHFDQPDQPFLAMARVLKPGGKLILMTTNANNYVPLVGRIVPQGLRSFAINRLLRRPGHESHPTFYRANTRHKMQRLADQCGLTLEQCFYVGNPFYLAFSEPLFWLALLFERVTDWRPLRGLKLYMLVVLRKAPDPL